MMRSEWLWFHAANIAVGATGIVYGIMRYALSPSDEWSVVNHPWQPHIQHLHVLFAPLLVFAVGVVWSRHVISKMRGEGDGRISGVGMLVGFIPMVASGYFMQVSVSPLWRDIWIGIHISASSLWILAGAIHLARIWLRRRASRGSSAPAFEEKCPSRRSNGSVCCISVSKTTRSRSLAEIGSESE
jgi:hypothetical protein